MNDPPIAGSPGRSYGGTGVPRKKKEKKSSRSQLEAERYTGFMHSLMGEEATKDNRQRIAHNVPESTGNVQTAVPFFHPEPLSTASYHSNPEQFSGESLYNYPYMHQSSLASSSPGAMQPGVDGTASCGFASYMSGYDFAKSIQMMPMQRFMESNSEDTYKYDSNAHQQLTEEAMRSQAPAYKFGKSSSSSPRDISENLSLKLECDDDAQKGGRKMDADGDGDSECHSVIGDIDQDPGKRKTRNQREQKRSLKISEQIDMLGQLLSSNGIDVKVNKYNILSKVSDYIKDLQQRNAAQGCSNTVDTTNREESTGPGSKGKKVQGSKGKLKNQSNADNTFSSKTGNRVENDHNYQNLNQTINRKKSNNIDELNDIGTRDTNTPESNTNSESGGLQTHPDFLEFSEENFFTVFQYCSIPWALARVDGRFCECNESFIRASGFSRAELLSSTIFNLINTSDLQDTFSAVGALLTNFHYGGTGSRFDPAAPASASSFETANATTIRRKAKLNTQKLNQEDLFEKNPEEDHYERDQDRKGWDGHSTLKNKRTTKLSQSHASTPPSSPISLDLVVSLVRAEVDKRPNYFHVRLMPSRTSWSPSRVPYKGIPYHQEQEEVQRLVQGQGHGQGQGRLSLGQETIVHEQEQRQRLRAVHHPNQLLLPTHESQLPSGKPLVPGSRFESSEINTEAPQWSAVCRDGSEGQGVRGSNMNSTVERSHSSSTYSSPEQQSREFYSIRAPVESLSHAQGQSQGQGQGQFRSQIIVEGQVVAQGGISNSSNTLMKSNSRQDQQQQQLLQLQQQHILQQQQQMQQQQLQQRQRMISTQALELEEKKSKHQHTQSLTTTTIEKNASGYYGDETAAKRQKDQSRSAFVAGDRHGVLERGADVLASSAYCDRPKSLPLKVASSTGKSSWAPQQYTAQPMYEGAWVGTGALGTGGLGGRPWGTGIEYDTQANTPASQEAQILGLKSSKSSSTRDCVDGGNRDIRGDTVVESYSIIGSDGHVDNRQLFDYVAIQKAKKRSTAETLIGNVDHVVSQKFQTSQERSSDISKESSSSTHAQSRTSIHQTGRDGVNYARSNDGQGQMQSEKNNFFREYEEETSRVPNRESIMTSDERMDDIKGSKSSLSGYSEISMSRDAGRDDAQNDSVSGYNYDNFFDDLMEVATSADLEGYFDPKTS